MKLFFTERFRRDYKGLPQDIQRRADKKLALLQKSSTHPSLRIKRVKKYKGVYELSITMDYRCLFVFQGGVCILIRAGRHDDVLK